MWCLRLRESRTHMKRRNIATCVMNFFEETLFADRLCCRQFLCNNFSNSTIIISGKINKTEHWTRNGKFYQCKRVRKSLRMHFDRNWPRTLFWFPLYKAQSTLSLLLEHLPLILSTHIHLVCSVKRRLIACLWSQPTNSIGNAMEA